MSRAFTSAGNSSLEQAVAAVSGYPITLSCWSKKSATGVFNSLMHISQGGSTANYVNLRWSTLDAITVESKDGSAASSANTTNTAVDTTSWHHCCGVFAATNSRTPYLDGQAGSTNSGSRILTGLANTGVRLSSTLEYDGLLAHYAIWNVALSADEIATLASGVSPLLVRPESLVRYLPFVGRDANDIDIIGGTTFTPGSASASDDEPPVLYFLGARAALTQAAATAPTFVVSPTKSAQTSTSMTLGYTASTSCTFYVAAVAAGAATPSAAQIKAGTGGGILFAANEAVTGADTTVLNFSGTPFPLYKIVALLSNGAGDSSIVVLDDQFLDAPAGKQFVTVVGLPWDPADFSILEGASPAAADGDVMVVDLVTTPNGYSVSVSSVGVPVIASGGDSSRQVFVANIYDKSAAVYSGEFNNWDGNLPPYIDSEAVTSFTFVKAQAITPVSLPLIVKDDDDGGANLTYALAASSPNPLPAWMTVDNTNKQLIGTPDAALSSYEIRMKGTDLPGDSAEISLFLTVIDIDGVGGGGGYQGIGLTTGRLMIGI